MKAHPLLLAGLCLTFGWLAQSQAQTQTQTPAARPAAAKPAATPAAAKPVDNKTLTLGSGKNPGGPILTRDELRVCLKEEERLRTRLTDLEGGRGPLDREKETLGVEQAALRADRAPLDELKKKTDDLAARLRDYAARVDAWNKGVTEFNANLRANTAASERQRVEFNRQRDELAKLLVELEAEKARHTAESEGMVRAYNARLAALDSRVVDWNQRNGQANETNQALEVERQAWLAACGDRRYREEDEQAVRAGK